MQQHPARGGVWLIALIAAACAALHAQRVLTPEFERLRLYEGTYDAEGGGTLELLASPRDNTLVAVVGGGRYPLKAAGPDLFVDATGRRVRLSIEKGREGYTLLDGGHAGRLFRRVGPAPPFDERVWFPRPHSNVGYRYAPREARPDGLDVGRVEGPPLDAARLQQMGEALAAGQHPDVHSVLIAHRGRLLYEEYFYEYEANTPHPRQRRIARGPSSSSAGSWRRWPGSRSRHSRASTCSIRSESRTGTGGSIRIPRASTPCASSRSRRATC